MEFWPQHLTYVKNAYQHPGHREDQTVLPMINNFCKLMTNLIAEIDVADPQTNFESSRSLLSILNWLIHVFRQTLGCCVREEPPKVGDGPGDGAADNECLEEAGISLNNLNTSVQSFIDNLNGDELKNQIRDCNDLPAQSPLELVYASVLRSLSPDSTFGKHSPAICSHFYLLRNRFLFMCFHS